MGWGRGYCYVGERPPVPGPHQRPPTASARRSQLAGVSVGVPARLGDEAMVQHRAQRAALNPHRRPWNRLPISQLASTGVTVACHRHTRHTRGAIASRDVGGPATSKSEPDHQPTGAGFVLITGTVLVILFFDARHLKRHREAGSPYRYGRDRRRGGNPRAGRSRRAGRGMLGHRKPASSDRPGYTLPGTALGPWSRDGVDVHRGGRAPLRRVARAGWLTCCATGMARDTRDVDGDPRRAALLVRARRTPAEPAAAKAADRGREGLPKPRPS